MSIYKKWNFKLGFNLYTGHITISDGLEFPESGRSEVLPLTLHEQCGQAEVSIEGGYWRGGLMVSALDSGSSGPGSGPGRGHCVVFLGKTLYSHGASLHPGV